MEARSNWSRLPDHIIVDILQYLKLTDKYHASLVCKSWCDCFHTHYIWREFDFKFVDDSSNHLNVFKKFGKFIEKTALYLDQGNATCRKHTISVLNKLVKLKVRKLRSFKIQFIGDNPIFYSGKEIIDALMPLCSTPCDNTKQQLQHVDLSGLTVTIEDDLVYSLSQNHPDLRSLNIINRVLICKVKPDTILQLVNSCRKLTNLGVFYSSMSNDILSALAQDDRIGIKKLIIKCRREEKYGKQLDGDLWQILTKKYPDFRVALIFDDSCPLHKVSEIMKYQIPVSVLRLETFTSITDELKQATRFYSNTITKLVLNTPMSKNCPDLNEALVECAKACQKINSIHVFCVLSEETVATVLDLLPIIKERHSYTLKFTDEPAPWIPGKDCGYDE